MGETRYDIIDADQHILEPPHIWKEYVPKKYQEHAPKLVKDHEGGDAWDHGTGAPHPIGLVCTPGQRFEDFRWFGNTYDSIRPGCYEGKARLKDMDIDGVDAAIIYPPERTIFRWLGHPDPDVSLAGIEAYNSFAFDEFCAADRTRLFPMYKIPSLGIDTALKHVKKAVQKGARGVLLGSWPNGSEVITDEDDRFWAACVEHGLPVHIHILMGSREALIKERSGGQSVTSDLRARGGRARSVGIGLASGIFTPVPPQIGQLIFSGAFDRFPELKVVLVEVGVGWIPHFLEILDDRYWRNRNWAGIELKEVPSYYWRKNFLATFMHDFVGIRLRHDVGVQNMMWSSDYPHHGNDWPYSRRLIDDMMKGVDSAERYDMVAGNAARILHLDEPSVSKDGAQRASRVRRKVAAAR